MGVFSIAWQCLPQGLPVCFEMLIWMLGTWELCSEAQCRCMENTLRARSLIHYLRI